MLQESTSQYDSALKTHSLSAPHLPAPVTRIHDSPPNPFTVHQSCPHQSLNDTTQLTIEPHPQESPKKQTLRILVTVEEFHSPTTPRQLDDPVLLINLSTHPHPRIHIPRLRGPVTSPSPPPNPTTTERRTHDISNPIESFTKPHKNDSCTNASPNSSD